MLHFPAEIHRTTSISEVTPQLLRALDADKVSAVQFLRGGKVRITCKTSEYRDDLLEGSSFLFGDVSIPVTAADLSIRSVYVRDLPFEVADCVVKSAFESFGVVHSVHPCFLRDFPSVANGTRRLVMSFRGCIPSTVSVAEFPVRVFHPGQPVTCSICREPGHLPRACPFSGLCLRCKQPGHAARNCTQAWGPSSTPVSVPSTVPVPVPVPASSSTPVAMSVDPSVLPCASSTPVSSVTAVSTPIPSVLPVSTSPPVPAPVSSCPAVPPSRPSTSTASVPAPVSSRPAAPPSRPSTSAHGSPSTASLTPGIKKLSRLLLNKARENSVFHTSAQGGYYTFDLDARSLFKLCQVIIKTHRLNVSEDEAHALAAAMADK